MLKDLKRGRYGVWMIAWSFITCMGYMVYYMVTRSISYGLLHGVLNTWSYYYMVLLLHSFITTWCYYFMVLCSRR